MKVLLLLLGLRVVVGCCGVEKVDRLAVEPQGEEQRQDPPALHAQWDARKARGARRVDPECVRHLARAQQRVPPLLQRVLAGPLGKPPPAMSVAPRAEELVPITADGRDRGEGVLVEERGRPQRSTRGSPIEAQDQDLIRSTLRLPAASHLCGVSSRCRASRCSSCRQACRSSACSSCKAGASLALG